MTEKQKKTIEAQVFEIQVQKVFLEVLETFDFTQEFAQENTCVDAFFRAMNKKLENKTLSDDLKNKYQSVIEKSYENIQEFVKQVKKLQQQVKQLETEKSSMKTLAEFNTKEQQIKKLEKELEELKKKAPENTASEEFTKMEKKLEDMEKKLEFAYKEFVKLTGEKAFAEGENKVLRESNEILNKHLITLISNHQNLSLALSKNLDTVTEKLTAVFGDSFTKVTDAFIRMAEVSKNENNNNPDDTEPPKNPSGDGGSGGAKATVQGSGNSENTFKNVGSPVFNINIPSRSSPEHTSSEDTFKKQKKNTKNESLDHNNNDDDDDDDDTPGGGGRGNGGGKGDDNNRKTQKNSGGGSESKDSSSNTASEETQPEISAQEPEQPAPKTPEKPNTPETEQQSSENTPENPQNTSSETQQAETTNNNPQTAEDFELRFPNDPALARLHFLMSERDKAERQGKILLKQILNKKITDVKNLIETKEGLNYMNEYYTIEKQLKNPELNRYERKNLEKRKEYVYDMAHNARTKPLDFAPYGNSIRGSTLNKYIRHKLGNVLFGDFVQDSEGKYYQKGLLPFAVRNAWEGTKIGAKTVVFSASLIAQAANAVVKDSFRAIDDVSLKPLRNTLRIGANTIQVIASMLGIPVSLFKLEKMHKYEPILNGKTIDNANKLVNLFPYLQRKTDQSSEEEEKVA
jgi:phage shock protein A